MNKSEAENILMNWLLDVFPEDQQNQSSYSRRLAARSLLHVIEEEIGMLPPEITIEACEDYPETKANIWDTWE
jgi:hypothetical protein